MLIKSRSDYAVETKPDRSRHGDQSLYSNMNQIFVRAAGGVAVPSGTVELRVKSAYFKVTVSLDVTEATA